MTTIMKKSSTRKSRTQKTDRITIEPAGYCIHSGVIKRRLLFHSSYLSLTTTEKAEYFDGIVALMNNKPITVSRVVAFLFEPTKEAMIESWKNYVIMSEKNKDNPKSAEEGPDEYIPGE